MTESSKKRKRNSEKQPTNNTVVNRSCIDANWQKLLSTKVMEVKTETPVQKDEKPHFTGTFRRSRKRKTKKPDEPSSFVHNSFSALNLNPDLNSNTEVENKPVTKNSEDKTNVTKEEQLPILNNGIKTKLTKFIAMDCEMVGIGYNGDDNMLARVSIVNKFGDCVYDKFVKPREEVKDYRTSVSGVRKEDLLNGEDFTMVQKQVAEILKGRILVGHALSHDLGVLFLSHPKKMIRDTSKYKPFRKITKGCTPSLKRLAKELLGADIQHGEHSSVEDARAVMQVYKVVAHKWEQALAGKRGHSKIKDSD